MDGISRSTRWKYIERKRRERVRIINGTQGTNQLNAAHIGKHLTQYTGPSSRTPANMALSDLNLLNLQMQLDSQKRNAISLEACHHFILATNIIILLVRWSVCKASKVQRPQQWSSKLPAIIWIV